MFCAARITPPRAGAAQVSLRHGRPEDVERPRDGCIYERELDNDDPEPRPAAELAPALAQIVDERSGLDSPRRELHRGDEDGPKPERRAVERDCPAGTERCDEEPAKGSASDQ
jgi:hypothetical protein